MVFKKTILLTIFVLVAINKISSKRSILDVLKIDD